MDNNDKEIEKLKDNIKEYIVEAEKFNELIDETDNDEEITLSDAKTGEVEEYFVEEQVEEQND